MAPTLCELVGCSMGPYPNGFGVDGRSVLPVLLNQQDTIQRDYIYVQDLGSGTPDSETTGRVPAWHGVRTTDSNPMGPYEYSVYATGECELYDLKADPWELTNRCNDPAYATQQAT